MANSHADIEKQEEVIQQCGIINDNYSHFSPRIEYICESVLCDEDTSPATRDEYANLKEQFHTLLLNACVNCKNDSCSSCHYGCNYVWDQESQELVLSPYKTHSMIYECTSMCDCTPEKCANRLVQLGPRPNLEVRYSSLFKSLGLFTKQRIPANAFICEYAGELLTPSIARRRHEYNYEQKEMNYILCLQESPMVTNCYKETSQRSILMTFVDPSHKGNIGRYLNHSCSPNCSIYSVRVDSPIPKIAIFSNRCIEAEEELCFHYTDGVPKNYVRRTQTFCHPRDRVNCLCGSINCESFLPNYNFIMDVVNDDE